ncbi:MAG: tyrosine-type recombinase/integrase [Chloroflexi bacterium]|nr:tyrosine-type recombinase/integrase [Chloroflexota bacterium]
MSTSLGTIDAGTVRAERPGQQTAFDGWGARRDDPLPAAPSRPLRPLIAEFTATFGSMWRPVTQRKHADDFARFIAWLETNQLPVTTAALAFPTLLAYVDDLRVRPKVTGVWRGAPDALTRAPARGSASTLSVNTVNAYVRPIRSLAIWLADEGILAVNPFRRSRRRAALNPLLPSEEIPTKGATLDDLRMLEAGCAGNRPIDLRDRAITSILVTTAARNSSVRLLRLDDVDFARSVIRFRRAKGGKTLELALQPATRAALTGYLERGRPALVGRAGPGAVATDDPGWLFPSARSGPVQPLTMNALSLMVTRRYRAGGGTLRYFGSHRIRHATATLLVNHGMPLEEVSRYLGHSSTDVTRRYAQQTPESLGRRAADALAQAGLVEAPGRGDLLMIRVNGRVVDELSATHRSGG